MSALTKDNLEKLPNAVPPGHRTPSLHQPTLSRRSSISAGHGQASGPTRDVDISQIGIPVHTPRKERPSHQRSLTGSYFPSTAHKVSDEDWPIGDKTTWQTAMQAEEVDPENTQDVANSIVRHVTTTLARQAINVDTLAAYQATALSVRDQLLKRWNETTGYHTARAPKRIYYLSIEWLLGRSLDNAVLNLGMKNTYEDATRKLGFNFEDLIDEERDAGLGNGGLGRLAACYIDSMATLNLPGWGYGLRYQYGIFKQLLSNSGEQLEAPDPWLDRESPWEIPRLDVTYPIRFYGHVENVANSDRAIWSGGQECLAVAYDTPIPGYGTKNCANIRLWKAVPQAGFDLNSFNAGNYEASVAASSDVGNITQVLYPNDNMYQGKLLRLKQQALWTSASLQDILRRFSKLDRPWSELPDYVCIQMNDTHPTLAIPELMRILIDEEDIPYSQAWKIVTKVFAYTNHTVLPEALEKWELSLFENLLPRHLQLIYKINYEFMGQVAKRWPGDMDRLRRMSIIEEGTPKYVRMAYLAIVGSFKVNGVAELHSQLLQSTIFRDFVEFKGRDFFTNVTNGITPRRWLLQCNPSLAALATHTLGSDHWLVESKQLSKLIPMADNPKFREAFRSIKQENKARLAEVLEKELGVSINVNSIFAAQIKRLHEYKRQTLNVFGIIARYLRIKKASPEERKKIQPWTFIFAGKAAPGYYIAKLVIRLINNVAKVVNNDPAVGDLLRVCFIPDYSVSIAEVLIPAADISVQISTAGTEASGTSNMKLALNGALLLGTVDGANIEIAEDSGEDQCFMFGHLAEQVQDVRYNNSYNPTSLEQRSPELYEVFKFIESGAFGEGQIYEALLKTVYDHDYYLVSNDFGSYLEAQRLVDELWGSDQDEWTKKSIITSFSMGDFSSDRSVQDYADGIWNVAAERVPDDQ
ncbi:carbohydrate phosphorylase-domain-containing protein [Kockovaella imperatae]|uniref:Alpha-1,4 glucan phosphorylase n=1 Tax=Kockovaella imperatae TaxID=4999 RepID=A0A1Y1ULV8_9TREE|nr:carbohydrate phosphorylase-domain-containing protein [Kockovaella imperatae]ORX39038.1 carbohydrate phosphorylase-domain-containing protein [Kockovaella imperatae]